MNEFECAAAQHFRNERKSHRKRKPFRARVPVDFGRGDWPFGTHAELLGHLEMPANPLDKIAHAVFANVPSVPGLLPRKQTILAIRRNDTQRSARLEDPARLPQGGLRSVESRVGKRWVRPW